MIHATPEGIVLRVRVTPCAARARIVGALGGARKVAVREPPEKRRAVARLFAETLGARDGAVVRGRAAGDKVVLFRGSSEAELRARLARLPRAPLW